MLSQIYIFTNLAVLLVGTWVVFYAFQAWKNFEKPYLKWFYFYCLTKVFFVAHLFVWRYLSVNVFPGIIENLDPTIENINDMVFSLVALTSITLFVRVVLGLDCRDLNRWAWRLVYGGAALIVIGYGARIAGPWGYTLFGWFDVVATYVTIRISYYEIIPAVLALYLGYRELDVDKALLLRGFGWFFVVAQALRWLHTPAWKLGLRGLPFEALFIATTLAAMFIPYAWLRCVYIPWASKEPPLLDDPGVLKAVANKYNISTRECEVIQLILDGKSNKEIQDKLVVSIHTVKNHVYNIYKKLGVNSRYSLIHFMTRYRDQG